MINSNLLKVKTHEKLLNESFKTIVTECFIQSLPFDLKDTSSEEKTKLIKYSCEALESLGGIKVLENSIENASGDRRLFLQDIYDVCESAAYEAACRITTEEASKKDATVDEVVDKAAFTKPELEKFVKNADKLQMNDVATMIKDKTKAVLLDEQERYQQEESIMQELQTALDDAKGTAMEGYSVDQYLNTFLEKGAPKYHMSLISKLQSVAYENLTYVENEQLSFDKQFEIIEKITHENVFGEKMYGKAQESLICALEAFGSSCAECPATNPLSQDTMGACSTMIGIIIYSLLETLNTLTLYSPSNQEIQKIVTSKIAGADILAAKFAEIQGRIKEKIVDTAKMVQDQSPAFELNRASETLDCIKQKLETIDYHTPEFDAFRNDATEKIDMVIKEATILNKKRYATATTTEETPSYIQRYREMDSASLSACYRNIVAKGGTLMRFTVHSLTGNTIQSILINGFTADDTINPVYSNDILLNYEISKLSFVNDIKALIAGSKIDTTSIKVCIYDADHCKTYCI